MLFTNAVIAALGLSVSVAAAPQRGRGGPPRGGGWRGGGFRGPVVVPVGGIGFGGFGLPIPAPLPIPIPVPQPYPVGGYAPPPPQYAPPPPQYAPGPGPAPDIFRYCESLNIPSSRLPNECKNYCNSVGREPWFC